MKKYITTRFTFLLQSCASLRFAALAGGHPNRRDYLPRTLLSAGNAGEAAEVGDSTWHVIGEPQWRVKSDRGQNNQTYA